MRFISSSLMLSGVLAMTMAGCGNGSEGGDASVEVGITAQPLETTTLPSEGEGSDPASQKHLVITVNQVKLHVAANGAGDETDEDSSRSGWKMAFSGETKVDLFDATTVEALLGTIEVPAGKITQVRLMLSDAELVEGATKTPVTCSSCSETGLKIILGGKVDVAEGDRLHLSLDVDQALSLTHDATGYRLAPVIKLVKKAEN